MEIRATVDGVPVPDDDDDVDRPPSLWWPLRSAEPLALTGMALAVGGLVGVAGAEVLTQALTVGTDSLSPKLITAVPSGVMAGVALLAVLAGVAALRLRDDDTAHWARALAAAAVLVGAVALVIDLAAFVAALLAHDQTTGVTSIPGP